MINRVVLLLVLFSYCALVNASEYVSDEAIEQGVQKCCHPAHQECCRSRLRHDKFIVCGPRVESLKAAVCLEKHFFNSSIIKQQAHECCWLLSTEKCRNKCLNNLRTPSLPPAHKYTFTNDCPQSEPSPNNRTSESGEDANEFACLLDRNHTLQKCFSACSGWMTRKSEKLDLEQMEEDGVEFDPAQHCAIYKEFAEKHPCLFPISSLLALQANFSGSSGGTNVQKPDEGGDS